MGLIYFAYVFIAANSVIVTFLIGMILLLKWILKDRFPASWHYTLWLIMVFKLTLPVIPFGHTGFINVLNRQQFPLLDQTVGFVQKQISSGAQTFKNNFFPADSRIQADNPQNRQHYPVEIYFFLVWFAGVLFLSIRYSVSYFRFRRFISRNRFPADSHLEEILLDCRKDSFTGKKVGIQIIEGLPTALVFGFFRPVLLIPSDYCRILDEKDLRLILHHELAHIRHNDTIWNGFFLLHRVLNWFNPIIGYGFRCLEEDREMARDAEAISYAGEGQSQNYGMLMIRLLEKKPPAGNPAPAGAAWISNMYSWKSRISRIALFHKNSPKWGTAALFLFFLLSVGTLVIAEPARRYDKIDLPFRNDPALIGDWLYKDSLYHPETFDPDHQLFHGKAMFQRCCCPSISCARSAGSLPIIHEIA